MVTTNPIVESELNRFRSFLVTEGLKLTREREALVREIFSTHYHFEADELLFRLKEKNTKISRATIYRTLELLVKGGMVRRVHLGEDHYHYHLVCTTCGTVIEFHDERLEKRQHEICEVHGFTPTFHNLQILGVCTSCRNKGERPEAPDRVTHIEISRHSLRK